MTNKKQNICGSYDYNVFTELYANFIEFKQIIEYKLMYIRTISTDNFLKTKFTKRFQFEMKFKNLKF